MRSTHPAPFISLALAWLESTLGGAQRVALPWVAPAFLRISTNPRAWEHPLDPRTAVDVVADWLGAGPVWTPEPGPGYPEILL